MRTATPRRTSLIRSWRWWLNLTALVLICAGGIEASAFEHWRVGFVLLALAICTHSYAEWGR